MQVNTKPTNTQRARLGGEASSTPSTLVRFPADFASPPTVRPGETVRFEIPREQILPFVAGPAYHGRDTWLGRLMVQVDGGEPRPHVFAQSQMSETGGYLGHAVKPVDVAIPEGASRVQVWIETRGIEGERFVSNGGANYAIPVAVATAANALTGSAPAGVAGSFDPKPQPVAADASPTAPSPSFGGLRIGAGGAKSIYALRLGAARDVERTSALAGSAAPRLTEQAIAAVDRFVANWDPVGRFVPENVDADGVVKDTRLSTLTQSRHLYGLARAAEATGDAGYLTKAAELGQSFRRHFVGHEVGGKTVAPFFHEQVEMDGASAVSKASAAGGDNLTVNQQAYGLAGLVALYRATRDPELLKDIRALHGAFVQRFHDDVHGGFFDHAHAGEGGNDGLKSYNSMVYVAMSYLADLAAVDTGAGAPDYLGLLKEVADLVADKFPDDKTGFIVENFDAQWRPAWREWQVQRAPDEHGVDREVSIGIVGHNTQAAWFLLRMFEGTGDEHYRDVAVGLLNHMLERGYDAEHGGFYNAIKREETRPAERFMWGTNKAWWQQAEGLQALMLADKLGLLPELAGGGVSGKRALEATLGFWQRFVRPGGGEFAEVERDGTPVPGDLGAFGKATYHVSQLAEVARDAAGNKG